MTTPATVRALVSAGVLPKEMASSEVCADSARYISSGRERIFLRLELKPFGFADLRLTDRTNPTLAAIGSGQGDSTALRSRYPDLFAAGVTVEMPTMNAFEDFQLLGNDALGGSVGFLPESKPEWLCSGLANQKDDALWCVPASLSILSQRVFGTFRSADELAPLWNQARGSSFKAESMYAPFSELCLNNGMRRFAAYGANKILDWPSVSSLKRPILLAFDQHAEVCIGTCGITSFRGAEVHGYCVLSPGSLDAQWVSFPERLSLDFAFTAPGPPCPGNSF